MFSRNSRDLSLERKSNNPKYLDAITLNLNGNKLTFVENQWIVQSDDLDRAATEIDLIIEERDELASSLKEIALHTDALNKEIIETNDMKNVALGMLMEERQKNHLLEKALQDYQDELKESYKMIIELRKALPESQLLESAIPANANSCLNSYIESRKK